LIGNLNGKVYGFLKNKKLIIMFSVVLVVLIGSAIYITVKGKTSKNASFQTFTVRRGNLNLVLKYSGTVKPLKEATISLNNIEGEVSKIYFKIGDSVKKGDLLAEFKNEQYDLDLQKAALNLQQKQMDYSDINDKLNIRAPNSGVIKDISVQKGDNINNGMLLAKIEDQSHTRVRIPFNQSQIKNIKVGQKAEVVLLDSLYKIEGMVEKVDKSGVLKSNGGLYYYVTIVMNGNYYSQNGNNLAQAQVYTDKGVEYGIESSSLEPPRTVEIRAGVSGVLKEVYVSENDVVSKDQLLFSIQGDGNDSPDKLQASLQSAELDYKQSALKYENLRVYSPIDGVVSEMNLHEGDVLKPSVSYSDTDQPYIKVVDNSKMKVVLSVDELDISKLKVGMPVKITSEAVKDKVFDGVIDSISNTGKVQNDVTTYDVTVVLDNCEGLKDGMTVDAQIMADQRENVLMVPVSALQERNGRYFVLVYNNGTNSNSPNSSTSTSSGRNIRSSNMPGILVPVEVGLVNDEFAEIKSGLKEGDKVILFSRNSTSNSSGNIQRQMFFMGNPPRRQ